MLGPLWTVLLRRDSHVGPKRPLAPADGPGRARVSAVSGLGTGAVGVLGGEGSLREERDGGLVGAGGAGAVDVVAAVVDADEAGAGSQGLAHAQAGFPRGGVIAAVLQDQDVTWAVRGDPD